MKATLINNATGERIEVRSTTRHPSCSYGQAVWVDCDNYAYLQVGLEALNPLYTIEVSYAQRKRYEIGQQIAAIRRAKGMTVRNLAKQAGITAANLSQIEQGNYSTGVDMLYRICDALEHRLVIEPK